MTTTPSTPDADTAASAENLWKMDAAKLSFAEALVSFTVLGDWLDSVNLHWFTSQHLPVAGKSGGFFPLYVENIELLIWSVLIGRF